MYTYENMEKIVKICHGKSCSERFSKYILTRLEADKEFYKYGENVKIETSLCMGRCNFWPNINIDGEIISGQNPIKSSEILKKKVEEWKKHYNI